MNLLQYNLLTVQGKTQLVLALLFGGVNVVNALMSNKLMEAAIIVAVSMLTYAVGTWILNKLLMKGMTNLAWVVAVHPMIEQVLLYYGLSFRGELADVLYRLTKVKAFDKASNSMEKPVLKTIKSKLNL
jgi:ABC-type multidrug transport system fused ATPase/permease subunit